MKKMRYDLVPIKEALLEAGRVATLSAIPLLIDGVSKWSVDWRSVAIVVIICFLRAVDKFAYESKKIDDSTVISKVKLPF